MYAGGDDGGNEGSGTRRRAKTGGMAGALGLLDCYEYAGTG